MKFDRIVQRGWLDYWRGTDSLLGRAIKRTDLRWLDRHMDGKVEGSSGAESDEPYPNGSVPSRWSQDESPVLRRKRFECASRNHYPRHFTGLWCFGYGYVCEECHMYADPVPRERLRDMCDELNALQSSEDQQLAMAKMSGGGPYRK